MAGIRPILRIANLDLKVEKVKGKERREEPLRLKIAVARLRKIQTAVADPPLLVLGLNLLLANEESLLQVKLTDLLALDSKRKLQ